MGPAQPDGQKQASRERSTSRQWRVGAAQEDQPVGVAYIYFFPGSSMVEQSAVNRLVLGSNPSLGAKSLVLTP